MALLRTPDAPDFSYEDERARGKALTRSLEALPKVTVRAMIAASLAADLMRESHPDYVGEDQAPLSRAESAVALEEALPHTPKERRDELTELTAAKVVREVPARELVRA